MRTQFDLEETKAAVATKTEKDKTVSKYFPMHLTQPTVLVQNRMGKELGFEFLDFNTTKRENTIHEQTQTKLTLYTQ